MTDRPRVLVLDEELPFPANTGKRIRTLHLLRRLTRSFEIDLLVHANGATQPALLEFERLGIRVHVASSQVPDKKGLQFVTRVAKNLWSSLPYSVATHNQLEYRNLLRSLLRGHDYDLVHCEWTPYAIYREDSTLPWVVSAHNIETEVWSRLAASETRPAMRWFLGVQATRMARFEESVFSSVGYATAVSDRDASRIVSWGCPRVQVVANGVDLEENPLLDPARMEAGHVVFVGSMDWRANQDGIRWYLDEVHKLLTELPEYQLTVVGRNPPPWLSAMAERDERLAVTGEVPDVRPYLERASLTIVPLRVGSGSRLKILEAFACGRTVVSTDIGAEGIEPSGERCLLIANEPRDFAATITLALQDARLRDSLVRAGRALVTKRYGWDRIAEDAETIWREGIAPRP